MWVVNDNKTLTPVIAKVGLTDGVSTEIAESSLKEGDLIVVGLEFDPNRPAPTIRRPGFGGFPMLHR